MESFRAAFERLAEKFVADVVAVVEAAAVSERPKPAPKRLIARPSGRTETRAAEPRVTVSTFDIPVGRSRPKSRNRPRRAPTTEVQQQATQAPAEQVVKFEVVPHPDRANRRMVLTRLGPAS